MPRAHPGIVEGGPHRGVAAPVVVTVATEDVVLVFPLPFVLTLSFAAVVEGGAARGHDGSCWSGRGGCYCCRGHPPLAGMKHNVEAYPWAAKLSSPISSSLRSLRIVWKEGNYCYRLMKMFM
jgi:hypothetical protein